jgi:hypothetical protein
MRTGKQQDSSAGGFQSLMNYFSARVIFTNMKEAEQLISEAHSVFINPENFLRE